MTGYQKRSGSMEERSWAEELLDRIWRGKGWLESWREGVIVPILKKGEGRKMIEYKRMTLMLTLYEVYT